jgi:hypothetical protein
MGAGINQREQTRTKENPDKLSENPRDESSRNGLETKRCAAETVRARLIYGCWQVELKLSSRRALRTRVEIAVEKIMKGF